MQMIPMTEVHSTMIKRVGYDDKISTLRIQFHNGDQWDYADVPPITAKQLFTASSIGVFFGRNIKPKFTGTKVTGEDDNSPRGETTRPGKQLVRVGQPIAEIKVTLVPDVEQAFETELARVRNVDCVTTAEQLDRAQHMRSIMKGWRIDLDKDRDAQKKPVRELADRIEQCYRAVIDQAEAEERRLETLVNTYVRSENDRHTSEQRRADQAARQAQSDAAFAQEAAEHSRQEAEEAAALGDERAEREARERASSFNLFAAEAAEAPPPVAPAPKVKLKLKLSFQVIGKNEAEQQASLRKFAVAFPHLVKIAPLTGLINTLLNNGGITELPGLEIVEQLKTGVRKLPSEALL